MPPIRPMTSVSEVCEWRSIRISAESSKFTWYYIKVTVSSRQGLTIKKFNSSTHRIVLGEWTAINKLHSGLFDVHFFNGRFFVYNVCVDDFALLSVG